MTATSFAVKIADLHTGRMSGILAFFWSLRIARGQPLLVGALVGLFLLTGSGAESRVMLCDPSVCDCAATEAAECPSGMTAMCKVNAPLTSMPGIRPSTFCPESSRVVSAVTERILPSQVPSPDLPPPRAARFPV